MKYAEITSSEHGNNCDLYPAGSIHPVELDEHGYRVLNRSAHYLPPFPFTIFETDDATFKKCPVCKMNYSTVTPFVVSGQIDDEQEQCMTCFEKKYIVNRRTLDGYVEALKKTIKLEYGIK